MWSEQSNRRHGNLRRSRDQGSVLVWLLVVGSLLTLILLAFLTRTVAIEARADDDRSATVAEWVLDGAVEEVMAKLADGFSAEGPMENRDGHVAAGPGLLAVRRYDVPPNRGEARGAAAFSQNSGLGSPFAGEFDGTPANPRLIPLFSQVLHAPRLRHLTVQGGRASGGNPDFNPAAAYNLNTSRNPFTPGVPLLSAQSGDPWTRLAVKNPEGSWQDQAAGPPALLGAGESSAERPVWVQWVPVREDPASPGGTSNRIVGRYAYWVDLENTKLRLDLPLLPLRSHPAFPLVLGESDALRGAGSAFTQSADHPHRQARSQAAGAVPFPFEESPGTLPGSPVIPVDERHTWSGAPGSGFAPLAARTARQAWFGWAADGSPPLVSAPARIDWDFFTALRPRGAGEKFALDEVMARLSAQWSRAPETVPADPGDALADVLGMESRQATAWSKAAAATARSFLAGAATLWGYDDERDPLGRLKIDLAQWQLGVTTGRTRPVDAGLIRASDLWRRLGEAGYYRALYPGAWPRRGEAANFHQSWEPFAGSGEAATLQMLVNLAEAAQPPTVPPLIDESRGIVGARSMPYVAEVVTRARSAIWLLPPEIRDEWLRRARLGDFSVAGETWEGRSMAEWAGLVELDLSFGLVNVDPFCTEPFRGELQVDLGWSNLPPRADVESGPFRAPIQGTYGVTSAPGGEPSNLRVQGRTVWFRLGLMPGTALDDTGAATCLRIRGWQIVRDAESEGGSPSVWHRVPVRRPGGGMPPEWWAMAQPGAAAGHWDDPTSLEAYRDPLRADHAASIGWFTSISGRRLQPGALFLSSAVFSSESDDLGTTLDEGEKAHRLKTWGEVALHTARLDGVFSEDPVLGHRTGDRSIDGRFGRGHFYGARGPVWRRLPMDPMERLPSFRYDTPLPWQTQNEFKEVAVTEVEYAQGGEAPGFNVPVWQAAGLTRRPSTTRLVIPTLQTRPGVSLIGRYFTSTQIAPINAGQAYTPSVPNSLCGMLLSPRFTGPVPQGEPKFQVPAEKPPVTVPWLNDVDVEPPAGIAPPETPLFKMDRKKGPFSLLCHAPPGRPFLSVGEIGFVHSGFPNRPILIGPDEGRTPWQLNSPLHGPPMRLLLDLFAPPVLSTTDGAVTEEDFLAGTHPRRRSPGQGAPNRAAWNVNTTPAHDDYMALREGGRTAAETEVKEDKLTADAAVHAVWLPGASGFARRATGSEAFRGRSLEDHLRKKPSQVLDRHLSPFPRFPRPWDMWLHMIAGDSSDARSLAGEAWGGGNSLTHYFGPGAFTWSPGRGGGPVTQPWVEFNPEAPGMAPCLTFGTDARHNERNTDDNILRGRHSADQHLDALNRPPLGYVPLEQATRYSLFPIRHFLSDLGLSYNSTAEFADIRTALNPRLHPAVVAGASVGPASRTQIVHASTAKRFDGTGFPGGAHSSGVFYHAPLSLLTPHADTSANAFTVYAVSQAVKDTGHVREDVARSGPGEIDDDDEVVAELWLKLTIEREPGSSPPRWRVVRRQKVRGPATSQ